MTSALVAAGPRSTPHSPLVQFEDREPAARVGAEAAGAPVYGACERRKLLHGGFIGIFRVDAFPDAKKKALAQKPHALLFDAHEMHLDRAFEWITHSAIRRFEVGAMATLCAA